MHKIQFRLGLRPRPHWGSSQCSSRPLVLLLREERGEEGGEKGKGGRGMGREGGEGKGGERKEQEGGRGREGEDPLDLLPSEKFSGYATA